MRRRSRKVVLIGLPGVGKSDLGLALARALHFPFFDSDHTPGAARQHQMSTALRSTGSEQDSDQWTADHDWLTRLAATSGPCVIAAPWTAVGAVSDGSVGDCTVLLLTSSIETLMRRLAADGCDDETLESLRTTWSQLVQHVEQLAQRADAVIETDHRQVETLVSHVVELLAHLGSQSSTASTR